ncbi:MAG: hypothetical protein ABI851_07865 [Saprospiraceae bacterium]
MKLLSFLFLTLFTLACGKESTNSKTTSYYFCYSHSWEPLDHSTVHNILYTDIQKIQNDEAILKDKTSEWSKFVKSQCKNIKGCTADLNYYYTAQEAETRMKELLEYYKDTEKYKLDKVKF